MKRVKLLTSEIYGKLKPLYHYENTPLAQVPVVAKFFTPDSSWTWWAWEYNPEDRVFFGLVKGHEVEFGYFSLDELEALRGPLGLPVERDLYFPNMTVAELLRQTGRPGGHR